jgi:inhibitor of cysteine peptidase
MNLNSRNFWLVLALLLIASCANQPAAISVGIELSGQTIRMQVGQQLAVTLPSNPSTGYRWEVETIDESLLLQQGEPEYQPLGITGTPMPGEGGSETYRFEAVSRGEAPLRLFYRHPSDDGEPAEIFFLMIKIQ